MKQKICAIVLFCIVTFQLLHSQSTNIDFESTSPGIYTTGNAVSGWSISSQVVYACPAPTTWVSGSSEFSIVSTPIPNFQGLGSIVGPIGNSPLGGNNVAALNNTTAINYTHTKLVQTFTVTNGTNFLNYAIAGAWLDGGLNHSCCEAAKFQINMYDCSGNLLNCLSHGFQANTTCLGSFNYTYSASTGIFWTDWQLKSLDLSPYIGSCVTLEVISSDCAYGGHYGSLLFDSFLSSTNHACTNCMPSNPQDINFCTGTNTAVINPPQANGTYSWTSPPSYPPLTSAQTTLSSLSIPNPTVGTVFTVNISPAAGCPYTLIYTLVNSSVAINAINTTTSCAQGATGSATVNAIGSGVGYTYLWTNGSSTPVGTSSVISNLSPGAYYLNVSAAAGCGTVASTVFVSSGTSTYSLLTNKLTCEKNMDGEVTFTYSPSSPTSKTLTIGSTGTTTVFFNTYNTTANSYTFNGLSGGGTYTTSIFDGTCTFTTGFSVNTFTTSNIYTLSPGSTTVCNGQNHTMNVVFTNGTNSSQYTYSWSPSTFMAPNSQVFPQATVSPTVMVGNILNTIYTVEVIPNSINCPSSKTIEVSVYNPEIPLISPVTACDNVLSYSISANPPGGLFYNNIGISAGGVFSPLALGAGTQTFAYSTNSLNCTAYTSGSFTILPAPVITITGKDTICKGQSTTFTASGADTYSWNTGTTGPTLTVNPFSTITYTVTGIDSQNSCPSKKNITVTTLPYPALSISGNTLLCSGATTTLSVSGVNTYTWNGVLVNHKLVISPSVTTTYTLVGTNLTGSCSVSRIVSVDVQDCTGLQESEALHTTIIYPNPVRDILTIQAIAPVTVVLSDAFGKFILEKTLDNEYNSINLSNYSNGIYLLKIINKSKIENIKLVKYN